VFAAIDVGSNTVRLLLGNKEQSKVSPQLYVRRITRLKGGQTEAGLSADSMTRTGTALREFSNIIAAHSVDMVRMVGTEALRSASNGLQFVERVFKETGLRLEIIAGDEEALLTATGVCSVFDSPLPGYVLVFDIGGGSTEFILLRQGEIVFQTSCKLGVVDLTETLTHLNSRHDFITATISSILAMVEPHLQKHNIKHAAVTLVGTAGTVTTLAAMNMQMDEYDWRRINGHVLDRRSIESLSAQLADLTVAQREMLPGMEQGRGDLIPAGIEIVLELMRQFHAEKLTVSDFGLLEGILLTLPTISGSND
jgi:exopolyphosphatase/guanosine-5'-triphosphate,3'-diphosphate pyrophosphatase